MIPVEHGCRRPATILFNELIASHGVKSIELNGFDLSAAGHAAPSRTRPAIFLYGGVRNALVQQHRCDDRHVGQHRPRTRSSSVTRPRRSRCSRRSIVNNITNLVFDSTATTIPTTPVTTPTVQFMINGAIRNFDIVSATTGDDPGRVPVRCSPSVGTTGRTAVQATAIDNLNVRGSAKNFTVSRSAEPFTSEASGLSHPAQGDVRRQRRRGGHRRQGHDRQAQVQARTGQSGGRLHGHRCQTACSCRRRPTERHPGSTGYPGGGPAGRTRSGPRRSSKLSVGPANVLTQTAQNPTSSSLTSRGIRRTPVSPGYSLTNAVDRHIGVDRQAQRRPAPSSTPRSRRASTTPRMSPGLEGTRGASRIARLERSGDLVNSVASASFRPANNHYSHGTGTAGNGQITGRGHGRTGSTRAAKRGRWATPVPGCFARRVNLMRRSH